MARRLEMYVPSIVAERPRYRELVALLTGLGCNLTHLDVGSGRGTLSILMSQFGWRCFALDDWNDYPLNYSGDQLDAIQTLDRELLTGAAVHFYQQDLFSGLPFEDEQFDVTTCLEVIEHLHQSPKFVLEEMARVTKIGGYCILSAPNSVNLRKRIRVLLGKSNLPSLHDFYNSPGVWRGHVREPTLGELKSMLTLAGFRIVRAGSITSTLWRASEDRTSWKRVAISIYAAIGRLVPALASGIMVVGQK